MNTFADFNIDLGGHAGTEVQTTCPQCSHARKKSRARCLSVNTAEGVWLCHHCDWRGSLKSGEESRSRPPKRMVKPSFDKPATIPRTVVDWFAKRGIPERIVARSYITLQTAYLPQVEEQVPCLVFPYFRDGEVINLKFRSLEGKHFRQVKDAEKILYGLDDLTENWAVIVEGECDKLALEVAGVLPVLSVPDGAPPANSKPSDHKFEYLHNCADALNRLNKIILAVDNDAPGKTLEAELARRLDPARCFRVSWPDGCKDANDVLLQYGAECLVDCITSAKPYPLAGVFTVAELATDVEQLYREGLPAGVSTGWQNVDRHYTVRAGEVTIVTGIPGHGKSEWLDGLAVNLAHEHGWSLGICSPENLPVARHIAKIIEKYSGFPFRESPTRRLPVEALQWVHDHFVFIAPEEGLTIPVLLQTAKQLVARHGINGLVIDPWNEFDHTRQIHQTETEYISMALGQIRRFARTHQVHVWIVAHPAKLYRREDGTYPVPTPYDISGSAHWRNKADNCLTVWRDVVEPDEPAKLYVQKIRFREVGKVGVTELIWNKTNGRYEDRVPIATGWKS